MKVALVHDYLKDFGGAERVLHVLSEMYPKAPIYTAFTKKGSPAWNEFNNKNVKESIFSPLIKHWRLYSPLRFLLPWIWKSIDLSKYDLVIASSSNYIARGFKFGNTTKVIVYCHTPPRFLYGLKTGFDWKKHWIIKMYGLLVAHFVRMFDFSSAQEINNWIANSENVRARIFKFYRKESIVIYPPIEVEKITKESKGVGKSNYFLIVSRLVGSKGLEEAIVAANKLNISLKVVGDAEGFTSVANRLKEIGNSNVEFLGRVPDHKLWKLYAQAKGFIALARDEDFGMTVVEAQAAGTPVIAFSGGGFKESIIDGKTGIFVDDTDVKTLKHAFEIFEKKKWDRKLIQKHAEKFSKERFVREMRLYVKRVVTE
ncbi:glycosyltransferase family 4 protein [Candidatus Microgenomates bacterium]|nr:MAG: glycosyltransferase family 4 protein [Candidatus Microgenomates bacterium]